MIDEQETLQEERVKEECRKITRELGKEKKLPGKVTEAAFSLLLKLGAHRGAVPSKEEVLELLSECCTNRLLRWQMRRLPMSEREKMLNPPVDAVDAYMESVVEGILRKRKRVSLNHVAKMTEFYKGVPIEVAKPRAKRVIHRVRERHRDFKSTDNVMRAYKAYGIPPDDFRELAEAGVISPSTPKHVLESIGKTYRHLYDVSKRLRPV